MPGPGLAYGATRCAVLRYRMVVLYWPTRCLLYCASVWCYALRGTESVWCVREQEAEEERKREEEREEERKREEEREESGDVGPHPQESRAGSGDVGPYPQGTSAPYRPTFLLRDVRYCCRPSCYGIASTAVGHLASGTNVGYLATGSAVLRKGMVLPGAGVAGEERESQVGRYPEYQRQVPRIPALGALSTSARCLEYQR
eukprot:3930829-Rhodomonas_salina.1